MEGVVIEIVSVYLTAVYSNIEGVLQITLAGTILHQIGMDDVAGVLPDVPYFVVCLKLIVFSGQA